MDRTQEPHSPCLVNTNLDPLKMIFHERYSVWNLTSSCKFDWTLDDNNHLKQCIGLLGLTSAKPSAEDMQKVLKSVGLDGYDSYVTSAGIPVNNIVVPKVESKLRALIKTMNMDDSAKLKHTYNFRQPRFASASVPVSPVSSVQHTTIHIDAPSPARSLDGRIVCLHAHEPMKPEKSVESFENTSFPEHHLEHKVEKERVPTTSSHSNPTSNKLDALRHQKGLAEITERTQNLARRKAELLVRKSAIASSSAGNPEKPVQLNISVPPLTRQTAKPTRIVSGAFPISTSPSIQRSSGATLSPTPKPLNLRTNASAASDQVRFSASKTDRPSPLPMMMSGGINSPVIPQTAPLRLPQRVTIQEPHMAYPTLPTTSKSAFAAPASPSPSSPSFTPPSPPPSSSSSPSPSRRIDIGQKGYQLHQADRGHQVHQGQHSNPGDGHSLRLHPQQNHGMGFPQTTPTKRFTTTTPLEKTAEHTRQIIDDARGVRDLFELDALCAAVLAAYGKLDRMRSREIAAVLRG